jgi:uncharacterized membrane protein YhiD involved in acid resistance
MTTGTGLILQAYVIVILVLGAVLFLGEVVRWAVARRIRRRQNRINYERRLRAAVARHPAGKRN